MKTFSLIESCSILLIYKLFVTTFRFIDSVIKLLISTTIHLYGGDQVTTLRYQVVNILLSMGCLGDNSYGLPIIK